MSSFNKVILMGNLARDPELRATPGGTQVCEVSLAVNDRYQDSRGQKHERVAFVDCVFWGKSAETLARWKKKGDPLLVEGRIQQDNWNDKETGAKRSKLKVVCTGFTFVARPQAGTQPASGQQGEPPEPGNYDDYATSLPNGMEEPPF